MSSFLKGFGLLPLTLGMCPTLIRFCPSASFYLCLLALDAINNTLGLLIAQRLEDRGQKFILLVADMPLEDFPQVGYFRSKFFTIGRDRFELSQELPCFSTSTDRIRN